MKIISPIPEGVTQFFLPENICTLQHLCNCHYKDAEKRCFEWLKAKHVFKSKFEENEFVIHNYSYLVSSFYPKCDQEKLFILCNIIEWGFKFDDSMDKNSDFFVNHLRILKDEPYNSTDVWEDIFHELWSKIKRDMSQNQRSRFFYEMQALLQAFNREKEFKQKSELPDFNSYVLIHRVSIGYTFFTLLLEYSLDIDVSILKSTDLDLSQLVILGAEITFLTNDLFSFRKEFFEENYFNAISILCFHERYTLQQAIDKICHLLKEKEREFIEIRDYILSKYPKIDSRENWELHQYVEGLAHMVSGNYYWSLKTGRYHGFDFEPITTPCNILLHPEKTIFTPA
jgi:5-epi-alpha-selinene synthase